GWQPCGHFTAWRPGKKNRGGKNRLYSRNAKSARETCRRIANMLARIRDTEIYFDVEGAGGVADGSRVVERPGVFLLHGGPGGDHAGFKPTHSALAEVAQLVFVDHRGCGRSVQGDPAAYTLDNNIDDLDALRGHLGLERISVLGSSYGGMV